MSVRATNHLPAPSFWSEYVDSIQAIRGALTDVLVSIGADAADSRDISERLGIHNLLAWRLSKIVTTSDAATPMRQMPGATGLRILAKAFAESGVPEARSQAFRSSLATYQQVIERHAGDTSTLEVMLASRQDDPAFADEAIKMRKQAFRGAAAVWGAQARIRLAMTVVSPTRGHDELLDLGTLLGFIDFRRLRESAFWPVHLGQLSTDAGTVIAPQGTTRPGPALVPQFCSTPMPDLEELQNGHQKFFAIKPGPVGKTRLLTWMVEQIKPAIVSRYRDAENEFGQYNLVVRMPVEFLQYDLLIHRGLSFGLPPEATVFRDTAGAFEILRTVPHARLQLPIAEPVVSLGSQPPAMSTPHVPQATEMAAYLCGRLGRELDEFTGYRFTMLYPPIPTEVFLRHSLETR